MSAERDKKILEEHPLIQDGQKLVPSVTRVFRTAPLAKLQPGCYTCQVSVLDPTAQKFAFWRAPVVVLPEAASGQ